MDILETTRDGDVCEIRNWPASHLSNTSNGNDHGDDYPMRALLFMIGLANKNQLLERLVAGT
jgi:hypothetical protein